LPVKVIMGPDQHSLPTAVRYYYRILLQLL